ncbi:MAG: glycosyltransferase involved in cell wall biosynthesis [Parasphingorhabdus sp.]|uniref:glycosyltransferase n=1 Tax=Parasphingorhabdus sp. TaxID=2709688 RepID=UPI0039E22C4D
MSIRAVHLVASIDNEAAGPSVSVPRLAEEQAKLGMEVELSTVATGDAPARRIAPAVQQHRHAPSFAGVPVVSRLVPSQSMVDDLTARASSIHIAHTHGLWLLPNVYSMKMAQAGTRLVLSPRGMLGKDALAFSRGKKRVFHALFQQRALAKTSLLHATSEAEIEDIRAFGLKTPVVLAPNGVDIPDSDAPAPKSGYRTILSLGRVHPKKGLDRLVSAFAALECEFPGWRLRIIGPSEIGYGEKLKQLVGELGASSITVEPPLFGADKLDAYREAEIFVLPTLHENFAMTVAEALAAGTPVISTKGAPWAGLETERCGRWIDHGVEPLAAALRATMALSDAERADMGVRGRAWMKRDFSWRAVASTLSDAYTWLVKKGEAPESVRFADPR